MTLTLRRAALTATAAATALVLAACGGSSDSSGTDTDASGEDGLGTLRVGALQTPAGDMLEYLEPAATEAGLDIEFVAFTDYNTPNQALADGSIDANLFQNATFMETFNSETGNELVSVGEAYLPSSAFYSDTLTDIADLPDGATVAIPNDPTNEGRALWLLSTEGIIEIADGATTPADITDNPRNLEFVEIENATLPQAVPDVDAAFVTITFALPAGLTGEDAILLEPSDSPYFNILATTPELEQDERVTALYDLLVSEDMADYQLETWGGLVVPAGQ